MSAARASGKGLRRLLVPVLLAAGALAGSVAVAEFVARWSDLGGANYYRDVNRYFKGALELAPGPDEVSPTGRIFQHKPGVDLEFSPFRFCTDARGLRAAAPSSELAAPGLRSRVLCLGDSVTLAWGVDDAESWPRLVERDGRSADGRALECLNAGHLMYDTVQEQRLLAAWGPELRPEIVLVTFLMNDLNPTWDQLQPAQNSAAPQPKLADPGFLGALLPRSCYALRALLGTWNLKREPSSYDAASNARRLFTPNAWPRARAALDRMLVTCGELGARLAVADHTDPPLPELVDWCNKRGVPCFPARFSAEEQRRGLANSWIDAHANALGNRLLADKMLAGLRQAGLLAPE
ncbi:MAG: SGNH/GDSL hydrolase family protein [Planctomycetes bacterium]|nr:SGNH/GDSL hydrolase family protein [Planctomycetota bacterium]